ncbi:MAG: hypothetical protein ABL933_08980 [Methyloglobulus sp.]
MISDVTQEEWGLIVAYFQPTDKLPKQDKRAIVNAIFYPNKTGCQYPKGINGGCCRVAFRLGKRYMTIGSSGTGAGFGRAYWMT